jgi:cysteinyl-tRNA synthetase
MAKSDGTFVTLQSLIDAGYDPEDFRYLCLGAHYRSQLNYSSDSLEGARYSRRNLTERLMRIEQDPVPLDRLGKGAGSYLASFREQIGTDLNMPKALSTLWNLIKDDTVPGGEKLAAVCDMDRVFGLGLEKTLEREDTLEPALMKLIAAREEARKCGDYARADSLRDELAGHGVVVEDTATGTRWLIEK